MSSKAEQQRPVAICHFFSRRGLLFQYKPISSIPCLLRKKKKTTKPSNPSLQDESVNPGPCPRNDLWAGKFGAARGKEVSFYYLVTVTAAAASGQTSAFYKPFSATVWSVDLQSHGSAGSLPILSLSSNYFILHLQGYLSSDIAQVPVYAVCFLFPWKQWHHSHCQCPVLTKA